MEKKSQSSKNIKVLYISPNGYLGGAERIVLTAAKGHLSGNRIFPCILFFKEGEAVTEARNAGIKCVVLRTPFKLSRPVSLLKALSELRKLIIESEAEILHNTMAYAHLVSSLASLRLGVKKVWFQHGPVGGALDKIATLFPVELMFYNSHFLKNLHHMSFPHSKIKKGEAIIRPGVEVSIIKRDLFKGPVIVFGMAGRICTGKAFHRIIEALAGTGAPFILLIAGSPKTSLDGLYLSELRMLTKELKVESKVHFLGHQESMGPFYQRVDVFIHASETAEPFGLVIAEAMGQGCLTVGTSDGGAKDFLINLDTGLTYSSQEEMRSIVVSLIRAPSLASYRETASRGQSFITGNYSTLQMVHTMENLYFELLS